MKQQNKTLNKFLAEYSFEDKSKKGDRAVIKSKILKTRKVKANILNIFWISNKILNIISIF